MPLTDKDLYEYRGERHLCPDCQRVEIAEYRDRCSACKLKLQRPTPPAKEPGQ